MSIFTHIAGALFLNRKARIDLYATIADLLDAQFALEEALAITARTSRDQGQNQQAWIVGRWQRALTRGRFAEEVGAFVPASEAMIFAAYGRVKAEALFAGAARVADLRDRQSAAVTQALAMPVLLFGTLVGMLWAAGGHFIPLFLPILPAHEWPLMGALFRDASLWLWDSWPLLLAALAVAGLALRFTLLTWTGSGRAVLDRIAPFSIYRTIVGTAFLFVLLEYLRAGLDLNDRTFNELKRSASPYTRHRIATIQRRMASGSSLGAAMMSSGHGFPDPALSPVVAALDGIPDWEIKLSRFVDRWVRRSEALMKARAMVLNIILSLTAALITGGLVQSFFAIMNAAARTTSHGQY